MQRSELCMYVCGVECGVAYVVLCRCDMGVCVCGGVECGVMRVGGGGCYVDVCGIGCAQFFVKKI
eukprot:m.47191 g.47191  ORF g.47191 m.47191 type:complete len:65 (+) comp7317_c0_seq2:2248-2442(+)